MKKGDRVKITEGCNIFDEYEKQMSAFFGLLEEVSYLEESISGKFGTLMSIEGEHVRVKVDGFENPYNDTGFIFISIDEISLVPKARVKINEDAEVASGPRRFLVDIFPDMAEFEKDMRGEEGDFLYVVGEDSYMIKLDNVENPGNNDGVCLHRDEITFLTGSTVRIRQHNDDPQNCIMDRDAFPVGSTAVIKCVIPKDNQKYLLENGDGEKQWATHSEIELW